MKNISLVFASFVLATLAACEESREEAQTGEGLRAISLVSDSNVAGFEYFIAPCGQAFPASGHYEKIRQQSLPGVAIDVLGDPFAEGSNHRFADYFKSLAEGCYQVKAVPVYARDGIKTPYSACSSPAREVQVSKGGTSETVLVSQCLGTDPGALDAVASLNHDPELLDIRFPDSKFSCGDFIDLCASARDSDGDPLEYEVTFASGVNCGSTGFVNTGDEMCTKIHCADPGSYEPVVTVYDLAVDPDTGAEVRMESLLERYGNTGADPNGNPWTSRSELQAIIHVDASGPNCGLTCQPYVGEQCYWMTNYGNNCMIPATWAGSRDRCKQLDSCSAGGGGASNGGCYVWADCSECSQEQPW